MLILILTDVQYSQKVAFSFEKGSNVQNSSYSGSLHPVKKFPPVKLPILPTLNRNLPPPTTYNYLEDPASMEQIFFPNSKKP